MRRALMVLLAVPALALCACSDDGDTVEVTTPVGTVADSTSAPDTDPDTATATSDASAATADDDATTATASTEESASTSGPVTDDVEGGAEGQAAADRAKEFLLALVDADPAACDLMISFSDTDRPMKDVAEDRELCRTELPETMAGAMEEQGLDEEGRAILAAMQINGAEIDADGTTAVIDADNYSELFAQSLGESTITLVAIDDEWFIDVDRFLSTP